MLILKVLQRQETKLSINKLEEGKKEGSAVRHSSIHILFYSFLSCDLTILPKDQFSTRVHSLSFFPYLEHRFVSTSNSNRIQEENK